jgi:virginiamycin B lyase
MVIRNVMAAALAVVVAACGGDSGGVTTTTPAATSTTSTTSTAATPPVATTTPAPTTTTVEAAPGIVPASRLEVVVFSVPAGAHPHDVAPAPDGGVWYTAQHQGALGHLDPATGEVVQIPLGAGSRPHGVIVGPDGAPWITDGGLNAIVTVDPATHEVTTHPLPSQWPDANLNTAVFDSHGLLWFTGQTGVIGVLDPETGDMQVFAAPGGRGPYGITVTPDDVVYYASLAGDHIARVDGPGVFTVIEPPTPNQGARRVWADSSGAVWVSEWRSGQVSRYDPASGEWRAWVLPGPSPQAYSVYVDDADAVWLTDFGGNAIVRFDPATETFDVFELEHGDARVRQMLGRPGEVWGAQSATDHLVVVRVRQEP